MKNNYSEEQKYNFLFIRENLEMILYTSVCFFIPFFMGHPQWLVGIIVNTSLVLAGMNLKNYKALLVIIAPSLGVLSKGIIFGPLTIFLVYMIPFIWISNAILVYAFKYIKTNKFLTLGIGAAMKTAFLFSAAFVMVKLSVLPSIFLTTMGLMQFYTAGVGGILALGIQKIKK